jgi:nicotinamide mononucleotide transporter
MTDTLIAAAAALSPWEIAAVVLAVAYLVLAVRQNILCWPAALASAGIYVGLMYTAGLYMESALQLFYIAMALYGWWHWHRGTADGSELRVSTWPVGHHVKALTAIAILTVASGRLLAVYTDAALVYADSFTTWAAIITTWMVARKVLENWYYWFVIDSVSVYLYVSRGLMLTALLFCIYLVLIVIGYRSWRRSMVAA